MFALILKTIGIKGGVIIALALALGFASWQVQGLKKSVNQKEQIILQKTGLIAQLEAQKATLEAEKTQAVQSYEALENACQSRVKEAVRIARIPHVYPKNNTSTIDANCPSLRVSDIQGN